MSSEPQAGSYVVDAEGNLTPNLDDEAMADRAKPKKQKKVEVKEDA